MRGRWPSAITSIPWPAGEAGVVVYRIDVSNRTTAAIEGWTLEIDAGDTVTLESPRIVTPADAAVPMSAISGSQLTLSGLPSLAVDGTLTLELPARASREGTVQVRVRSKSAAGEAGPEGVETTLVNPPASAGR